MVSISYVLFLTSVACFTGLFLDCHGENRTVDLNKRLSELRNLMKKHNLSAYIIPNEDDHQTEEPAVGDKRREFISGFTGTAGHALVALNNATLWTDGRYYLQAAQQLPSMWTLERHSKIPDMASWLKQYIHEGECVGVDPKKIILSTWKKLEDSLREHNIQLIALDNNLLDEIWEDHPGYSKDPLFIHDIKYCGEAYESKLQRLRQQMNNSESDLLVVTALDEIAWLFNLRGNDLLHSPLFMSYALIKKDSATLYVETEKITSIVKQHLQKIASAEVQIKPYNEFWIDLNVASQSANKTFIPHQTNYAVHLKVPENRTYLSTSPLLDMKAAKNAIEVEGSRKAHIRDSIAICSLFKLMEDEIPKGVSWDEMKVARVLDELRKEIGKDLYKGTSFTTQAAFGAHSALPHYSSKSHTNVIINISAPLTLDSGGQYLDGTIDTTRVIHLGEPTEFQKVIYTSLLEGVIDLATTVFPEGIGIDSLEILPRRPLLKLGLTFSHGTVHGTGIFSNVHENFNRTYFENFIGSQGKEKAIASLLIALNVLEPGYYLEGQFGMRLENLIVVEKAQVQNENNPKRLLAFSPLTLVPYERKLMNLSNLDFRQISWVNNYHEIVKQYVGNEMIKQDKQDLFKWLLEKTKPISVSKGRAVRRTDHTVSKGREV